MKIIGIRFNSTLDKANDLYKLINGAKPQDLVYRPNPKVVHHNAANTQVQDRGAGFISRIVKRIQDIFRG